MLNLRTIHWMLLSSVVAMGLTACEKGREPVKPAVAKPLEMLSADGIGPLNAETTFNLHELTMVFQGLNVTQRTNYSEGEQYPVIQVAKGLKTLLTINPDLQQEKIFSVQVHDNLIGNQLGHGIGMKFADIYAYDQLEDCGAGAEEMSGKVLCYAPKTPNILYLFAGSWNGPDGQVPPSDVLARWKLEGMVWKPPVAVATQ